METVLEKKTPLVQPNVMIGLWVNGGVVDVCAVCMCQFASARMLSLEFFGALKGKVLGLFADQQVNGPKNVKS